MTWGRFTGGRPFAPGHDPRRNTTGIRRFGYRRRDTFEMFVNTNPDLALDILEAKGLIPKLFERYQNRERRPVHLGGPKWRRPRLWRGER